MTQAQNRVYQAIKNFIEKRGYSPSYSDIMRVTGLKSPSSVMNHINSLKSQGYVEHRYNKGRSLALCPDKVMQGFRRCRAGHEEVFFRAKSCPICVIVEHFDKKMRLTSNLV